MSAKKTLKTLCTEIKACTACMPHLELGPRPVFSVSKTSRIIIIGQAPGTVVHRTGIPWDDKSGENLRRWMKMDDEVFYDSSKVGIVPMGFCYPGKGKSGDLAPRKECAPLWHDQLFKEMNSIDLILLIGQYAQSYYLKDRAKRTLTETVKSYKEYLPEYFVLPHPSPRNNIWMKKNEWFKEEVLPVLSSSIKKLNL